VITMQKLVITLEKRDGSFEEAPHIKGAEVLVLQAVKVRAAYVDTSTGKETVSVTKSVNGTGAAIIQKAINSLKEKAGSPQ
jgi:hypothetical protein